MSAINPTFAGPSGRSQTLGPLSALRLEGEVMREVVGGPVLAKHLDHAWTVNGERYTRCDCGCRVSVHFERVDGTVSRTYGPYESFSFVDGIAFGNGEVFAFADRTMVDWYCKLDDVHWPLMVIMPAS